MGDALELHMNMCNSLASWLGTDACFDHAEVERCSSKLDHSGVGPRDKWTEYTSDAPKLDPCVLSVGVVNGGGARAINRGEEVNVVGGRAPHGDAQAAIVRHLDLRLHVATLSYGLWVKGGYDGGAAMEAEHVEEVGSPLLFFGLSVGVEVFER
jgi:hypothetical protein